MRKVQWLRDKMNEAQCFVGGQECLHLEYFWNWVKTGWFKPRMWNEEWGRGARGKESLLESKEKNEEDIRG